MQNDLNNRFNFVTPDLLLIRIWLHNGVLSQEHVTCQSGCRNCRVGSLQLIQQGCFDNKIDHKVVLGFISCYILIIAY